MTDKTAPNVTDKDRRLARDWAESIESATNSVESTTNPWSDRALAAARVILNAIPTPPRPTLADMTPKERVACRWMQCDVEGEDARAVIINPHWEDGSARVLWPGGIIEQIGWGRVTPRPDLPRMEWPGNKKPVPALPEGWRLADHKENGRVIVTNTTPNIEGRVYYVLPSADPLGFDWLFCDPGELTYLDQEADQ